MPFELLAFKLQLKQKSQIKFVLNYIKNNWYSECHIQNWTAKPYLLNIGHGHLASTQMFNILKLFFVKLVLCSASRFLIY